MARVFVLKVGVLPDRVLVPLLNDRMVAKVCPPLRAAAEIFIAVFMSQKHPRQSAAIGAGVSCAEASSTGHGSKVVSSAGAVKAVKCSMQHEPDCEGSELQHAART